MFSLSEFRQILVDRKVFIMVVGFLMSDEIRRVTRSLIDNIIEPIFNFDINDTICTCSLHVMG